MGGEQFAAVARRRPDFVEEDCRVLQSGTENALNRGRRLALTMRYIGAKRRQLPLGIFIRRSIFYSFFYLVYFLRRIPGNPRSAIYCFPYLIRRPYGLWKCLRLTGTIMDEVPRGGVRLAVAHFDMTSVHPDEVARHKETWPPGTSSFMRIVYRYRRKSWRRTSNRSSAMRSASIRRTMSAPA